MWRKVILIIFVVVMLGTFGLSPASAGKANDTLNIGFQQEFENLDSMRSKYPVATAICSTSFAPRDTITVMTSMGGV